MPNENHLKLIERAAMLGGAAILLAASVALGVPPASAASSVDPPAGAPKFLGKPYAGSGVSIGQGWYYAQGSRSPSRGCPAPGGDIHGWHAHCGVDFSKNDGGTFQIVAAASGRAQRFNTKTEAGSFIAVEHSVGGKTFCTRYLHTDPSKPGVPAGRWTTVDRGDPIAWAGRTGTSSIHLHFDVRVGGCDGPKVDPFDIAGRLIRARIPPTEEYYPGGSRFSGCGQNSLWASCSR